jgi:branched-chain amino acid transport system permease protein
MEQNIAVQVILNGLSTGLIYVLMALGFSLIFSILGVFNFAHGEFYMLGAVLIYFVTSVAGLPFPVGLLVAVLAIGLLGLLIEKLMFRPLADQGLSSFIVALGLSMGLSSLTAVIIGSRGKYVSQPISGVIKFLGSTISWYTLIVIIASLFLVLVLYIIINYTKFGRTIRAIASNPKASLLVGVKTKAIRSQTFAIATGLAAAAGALTAPLYYVTPYIGNQVIFKVMVVVILGGLGSIPGAVFGGLILGFIESIGLTYVGGIANIFGWLFVIVLLLVRPQGLMGKK